MDARDGLERIRRDRLAAQLGGAAGTLAALGDGASRSPASSPASSTCPSRQLPWHADRQRIAELGAALATAAGVGGEDRGRHRPALADRGGGGGRGRGRRVLDDAPEANPAASVRAIACARQARGHASVLLAAVDGRARARGRARGSRSGPPSPERSRAPAARRRMSPKRSPASRSTPSACARTSTRPAGIVLAERVSQLLAPRGSAARGGARGRRGRRGDRLVPVGARRRRAGGALRPTRWTRCSTRRTISAPPRRWSTARWHGTRRGTEAEREGAPSDRRRGARRSCS